LFSSPLTCAKVNVAQGGNDGPIYKLGHPNYINRLWVDNGGDVDVRNVEEKRYNFEHKSGFGIACARYGIDDNIANGKKENAGNGRSTLINYAL
jgi:hypothetical protein